MSSRPGGAPPTGRSSSETSGNFACLNAIRYLLKTGCQWRMLLKDFPPKSTMHEAFVYLAMISYHARRQSAACGSQECQAMLWILTW